MNFSFVRSGLDNKKRVWAGYEETFSGYAVVFALLCTSFAFLIVAPEMFENNLLTIYGNIKIFSSFI